MFTWVSSQYTEVDSPETVWKRWKAQNYTWDGLKSKAAAGYDSLQDFWLRTPQTAHRRSVEDLRNTGELIEVDGQPTYHIAHLPLMYPDGTPTLKLTDPELSKTRLIAAMAPHNRENYGHLNLEGAVLVDWTYRITKRTTAIFNNAIFQGTASFQGTVCERGITFEAAAFLSDANFNSTRFQSETNLGGVSFLGRFWAWMAEMTSVTFNNSLFVGSFDVVNAAFLKDFSCDMVVFRGDFRFSQCRVEANCTFNRCLFYMGMDFSESVFQKRFAVLHCQWPALIKHFYGAFNRTRFNGLADFSGTGFRVFGAFDGASFEKGVKLDRTKERESDILFKKELRQASMSVKTEDHKRMGSQNLFRIDDSESRLMELESGCRILRQEMIKQGDKSREHLLYKYESIARREQSSTPGAERFISHLYDVTSDYGASITTPAIWLLTLSWFYAQIYAVSFPVIATSGSDKLLYGLLVSFSRIFPFGAFGDVTSSFASDIYRLGMPWTSGLFMLVATSQSFFAIILIFLCGLAVRRKFQIG